MRVYFDSVQEGQWFSGLHPRLADADLAPFPSAKWMPQYLVEVLSYDRPDIVLVDNERPILVLERTIEVPSGHNVGQRFARLVAAARQKVPVLYFGPYAAYKHGGITQGPRYMNLRLFHALSSLAEIEQSAVTAVRWPVDDRFEIIQTPDKNIRIIEYFRLFFDLYEHLSLEQLTSAIKASVFEKEQEKERDDFIRECVRNPEQYDMPPNSVALRSSDDIAIEFGFRPEGLLDEAVLYNVGMTYIRSDPYTGMGLLYSYLYCNGLENRTRSMIFHFPKITKEMWLAAASGRPRKDIRLYRLAADAIIFSDDFALKIDL